MSNQDKIVGYIRESSDYEKFKFINSNRELRKLEKLTKEIKKFGLLNPIKVNEKFEIIDGQHRFTVLKNLGLPIEYFVGERTGISEVLSMNTSAKTWKIDDYIHSFAEDGYQPYVLLRELREVYPKVSVSSYLDIAYLNKTGSTVDKSTGSQKSMEALRSGDFEFYNYESFIDYLLYYLEVTEDGPAKSAPLFKSLFRLWSLEEFDPERLLSKKYQLKLKIRNVRIGQQDALLTLLDVYNSNLKINSKKRINFGFDYKQDLLLSGTTKKIDDQRKLVKGVKK